MIRNPYNPTLLLVMLMLQVTAVPAQNISFRTLAPDAITLTPQGSIDLEFDFLYLDSDIVNTITINDTGRLVALAIDAPAHFDLTATIRMKDKNRLLLNGTNSAQWIPFNLEFAYANAGYPLTVNYVAALKDAVAVPGGYNSITFPVSKPAKRLAPPPPTPKYKGYTLNTTKQRAFLFFFGSLGPANKGNLVVAGSYETIIDVIIDFTSHDD